MRIALRIVAATLRGAREHAPRLAELLARRAAGATFYFNLGPHRLRRWLPGREVGGRAVEAIRRVRDAGFEIGVHGWDAVRWPGAQDDPAWVEQAMRRACERFEAICGEPPHTHAAPSWRMSRHAFRLTQRLGFHYCSDTRGTGPFVPLCDAELIACPQIPTTLPTLEELLDRAGITSETVHRELLERSEHPAPAGHVFTYVADRKGMRLAPVLERLLDGWRVLGYEVVSLRAVAESLEPKALAYHAVVDASHAGRAAKVATQGPEFLALEGEVAPAIDSRNNALATAAGEP